MENEYAILSFTIISNDDYENREASKIELTVPSDMTIWEYRTMCKRLASTIGYTNKSIESAFPHIELDMNDELERFNEHIKQLLNNKQINNEK